MNSKVKHILRASKWPVFLLVIILGFIWGFVPLAKWLFVGKTLEVYNEVADNYSNDADNVPYQGIIIDTILQPSKTEKGKIDTIVHQQSILLEPQSISTDGKPQREDVGTFGDGAGLFNAFFSFLAFMAVLLTIYLQSRKDGHDKQNGARVLFEQEFFAMVGMLENIVSHLRFCDRLNLEQSKVIADATKELLKKYNIYGNLNSNKDKNSPQLKVVEGRDVFRYLYADRENYSLRSIVGKDKDIRATMESQEYCFDGTLDHYFRYLYRILKHIDESKLLDSLDEPQKEKEYYAHILRAQLSNYELLMLFYNGLLGENPNTIKKLVEKYSMFNNLRAWELGKFQKEYYQAILDEEICENPDNFDPQITYSVAAFWDDNKLREFKERDAKNPVKEWFYAHMRKLTTWLNKKYGQEEMGDTEIEKNPVVENETVGTKLVERQNVEDKEDKHLLPPKGSSKAQHKPKKKKKGDRKRRKK